MADEPPRKSVDDAPISPVGAENPARSNSLEHYLQNRPNREELVQSKLLPSVSSAASALHLATSAPVAVASQRAEAP